MRWLCLLLIVGTARAQADGYRPLAVGNTWTYAVSTASNTSPTLTPASDVQVTVLRDTTIGGVPHRLLQVVVVAFSSTPDLLAVPLADGATVLVRGSAASGFHYLYRGTAAASTTTRIANPLVVGSSSYPMTRIAGVEPLANPSETFLPRRYFNDFADPIGQARFEIYEGRSSSVWNRRVWTLKAARVGGRSYGVPTAGDERPRVGVGVAATPTPARADVTIRTGADRAAVAVYDALGRLVFAGDAVGGRLAVSVAGWAPGAYIVRAVAPDGTEGSARLAVVR